MAHAVQNLGLRGLKLHPTTGFYPDDPVCRPFYEKALALDVPVMFHTGTQPAPLKAKYARPTYVDSVAADFPDLKIIMAHVGHCWWEEALTLAGTKPNLSVEFSGWQREFLVDPKRFYAMLRTDLRLMKPPADKRCWRKSNPVLTMPSFLILQCLAGADSTYSRRSRHNILLCPY